MASTPPPGGGGGPNHNRRFSRISYSSNEDASRMQPHQDQGEHSRSLFASHGHRRTQSQPQVPPPESLFSSNVSLQRTASRTQSEGFQFAVRTNRSLSQFQSPITLPNADIFQSPPRRRDEVPPVPTIPPVYLATEPQGEPMDVEEPLIHEELADDGSEVFMSDVADSNLASTDDHIQPDAFKPSRGFPIRRGLAKLMAKASRASLRSKPYDLWRATAGSSAQAARAGSPKASVITPTAKVILQDDNGSSADMPGDAMQGVTSTTSPVDFDPAFRRLAEYYAKSRGPVVKYHVREAGLRDTVENRRPAVLAQSDLDFCKRACPNDDVGAERLLDALAMSTTAMKQELGIKGHKRDESRREYAKRLAEQRAGGGKPQSQDDKSRAKGEKLQAGGEMPRSKDGTPRSRDEKPRAAFALVLAAPMDRQVEALVKAVLKQYETPQQLHRQAAFRGFWPHSPPGAGHFIDEKPVGDLNGIALIFAQHLIRDASRVRPFNIITGNVEQDEVDEILESWYHFWCPEGDQNKQSNPESGFMRLAKEYARHSAATNVKEVRKRDRKARPDYDLALELAQHGFGPYAERTESGTQITRSNLALEERDTLELQALAVDRGYDVGENDNGVSNSGDRGLLLQWHHQWEIEHSDLLPIDGLRNHQLLHLANALRHPDEPTRISTNDPSHGVLRRELVQWIVEQFAASKSRHRQSLLATIPEDEPDKDEDDGAGTYLAPMPQSNPLTSEYLDLPWHTYAEILALARENAAIANTPRNRYSNYVYHDLGTKDLGKLLRQRGVLSLQAIPPAQRTKPNLIQWLEIYDAKRGIEPRLPLEAVTQYHGLNKWQLQELIRSKGLEHQGEVGKLTRRTCVELLLTNEEANSSYQIPEADRRVIAQLLLRDLDISLQALGNIGSQTQTTGTHRTWTQALMADTVAMEHLQSTALNGMGPSSLGPSSNRGLLCGVRALAAALNSVRRVLWRAQHWEGSPRSIHIDEVMAVLFNDYDSDPANDVTDQRFGDPTDEFRAFIDGQLRSNGHHPAEPMYQELYLQMTASNNFNADQLRNILDFLFERRFYSRVMGDHADVRYNLGVVIESHRLPGTIERVPAQAFMLGQVEETLPTVFLLHDGRNARDDESVEIGHWEPFEQHVGSPHLIAWGIRTADALDYEVSNEPKTFRPPPGSLNVTDLFGEAVAANAEKGQKAKNERMRRARERAKQRFALRMVCKPCLANKHVDCDGKAGQKICSNCRDNNFECVFDDAANPAPTLMPGNEVTPTDIRADQKMNVDYPALTIGDYHLLHEPKPDGKHYLVYVFNRFSSDQGDDAKLAVIQRQPQYALRWDNFLAQNQGASRPGGANTPAQNVGVVCTRQGTRRIPTALDPEMDPIMAMWVVNHMRSVFQPPNPDPPIEVHFLLGGLAGFSVNIDGWGDRQRGFFKFILDSDVQAGYARGQGLASRIFLVPHVQDRVVRGQFPESVGAPNDLQGWTFYHNQYVKKYRLEQLIDRNSQRQARLTYNMGPQNRTLLEQELDEMLDAMDQECAFRSYQLDVHTIPTHAQVAGRNIGRNGRWA